MTEKIIYIMTANIINEITSPQELKDSDDFSNI